MTELVVEEFDPVPQDCRSHDNFEDRRFDKQVADIILYPVAFKGHDGTCGVTPIEMALQTLVYDEPADQKILKLNPASKTSLYDFFSTMQEEAHRNVLYGAGLLVAVTCLYPDRNKRFNIVPVAELNMSEEHVDFLREFASAAINNVKANSFQVQDRFNSETN